MVALFLWKGGAVVQRQIEGQINFFDYLASLKGSEQGQKLLAIGQKIYRVFLCNIKEYVIRDIYPIEDKPSLHGLVLEGTEGASKTCDTDDNLGKNFFLHLEDAEKEAKKKEEKVHVIYAKDLHPVSWKVYYYHRKCDGYKMYMFYAMLDNGYVYAKDKYTYHYLKKCTEEEALAHLMKQVEETAEECIEENTIPFPLENMYQCKGGSDKWLYTEAECGYVIGRENGGGNDE